jgi:ABC-type multidrug transport system ATPase subunit
MTKSQEVPTSNRSHNGLPPTDSPPGLLWTKGLTKSFGSFTLGPIDAAFQRGETIALLGKNGAGKTTFFELLTGHMDATAGSVHLDRHRVTPETTDIKRRMGYLPQYPRLPLWVTPHDLLVYAATLLGADTNESLTQAATPVTLHPIGDLANHVAAAEEYWDCASYRHKPLGTLSYGMQKRVGLALATLHDPEVLILDEPHSGLDIFHCRALDDAIRKRAQGGKTTIISTHVAAFAASTCERVIAIEKGVLEELASWKASSFLERIDLIEKRFFNNT